MSDQNTTLRPDSPLNHKDPIKEQIEFDTIEWCDFMLQSEEDYDRFSHQSGRENQDKVATNRTVETALKLFNEWCSSSIGKDVKSDTFIQELENLKK